MSEVKNYYDVLELPTNARAEEIYYSYQRTKAAYSSDSLALYSLMSPDECRNIMESVEEAYAILSDPEKRKKYDEVRGINKDFNVHHYNSLSDRVSPIRKEQSFRMESPRYQNEAPIMRRPESQHFEQSYQNQNPTQNASNVSKLVTQKRFQLDFVVNSDFESEIENTTDFTGEFLKKIREYKNVDLDRLCDMTKVSKMHLQNIELEDFGKLPAAVYVRGFVFQYAKCLKLSPDIVANSYLQRMKKLKT